jgi:hypothetical protein
MKTFIAAPFGKKDEVREWFKILKGMGHEITADWTLHTPIQPYEENTDVAKAYSLEDMKGVRDCDVFVIFTEDGQFNTCGRHSELGAAIMLNTMTGKPDIYCIGKSRNASNFYFHPAVKYMATKEEFFKEIEGI